MKPERALELVARYAELTKQIKRLTSEIGSSLDQCKGVSGKRGQYASTLDELLARKDDRDDRGRDKDLHLWNWYQPEWDDDSGREWEEVTLAKHGKECCHCYSAHLAIQLRKQARKELGIVKGVMSRSIA